MDAFKRYLSIACVIIFWAQPSINTTITFKNKNTEIVKLDFHSILIFKNFKNISEICLECIDFRFITILRQIDIMPNEFIVYNNLFNFSQLNSKIIIKSGIIFEIKANKIKGFDSTEPIFYPFKRSSSKIDLSFYHSKLIYLKECKSSGTDGIFRSIDILEFSFTVKYFKKTCPLIFKDTYLESLTFNGLSKSFIKYNQIDFSNILPKNLNSSVQQLNLNFFKGILDKNFLIFNNLKYVLFNGLLDQISDDAFDLVAPKLIRLDLDNKFELISKGFKWLLTLNKNLKIDFTDLNSIKENLNKAIFLSLDSAPGYSINPNIYSFPEEDLCIFYSFPKNKFLFFIFENFYLNCSCLMIWLSSTARFVFNASIAKSLKMPIVPSSCLVGLEFEKRMEQCNFERLTKNCHKREKFILISSSLIFYYSQIADLFITALMIFFIILTFSSNSLNFFILSKIQHSKRKNSNNESLGIEKLMSINCIINILYLVKHFIL